MRRRPLLPLRRTPPALPQRARCPGQRAPPPAPRRAPAIPLRRSGPRALAGLQLPPWVLRFLGTHLSRCWPAVRRLPTAGTEALCSHRGMRALAGARQPPRAAPPRLAQVSDRAGPRGRRAEALAGAEGGSAGASDATASVPPGAEECSRPTASDRGAESRSAGGARRGLVGRRRRAPGHRRKVPARAVREPAPKPAPLRALRQRSPLAWGPGGPARSEARGWGARGRW